MRYLIFIFLIFVTSEARARIICENGYVETGATEKEIIEKCGKDRYMGGKFLSEEIINKDDFIEYKVITRDLENGDVISFVLINDKLRMIIK